MEGRPVAQAPMGSRSMPLLWCEYFEAQAASNVDDIRLQLVMTFCEHLSHPSQDSLWRGTHVARDGSTVLHFDAMRLPAQTLMVMEEDPGVALACLSIAVNEASVQKNRQVASL